MTQSTDIEYLKKVQQEITFGEDQAEGDRPGADGPSDAPESGREVRPPGIRRATLTLPRAKAPQDRTK
jgi:hypothetical protein